jgi:pimeloyl-ACP methyl ester carboxylesterase
MNASVEPITGRYINLSISGKSHRIYFEEAGQGIPLICLHTAGSDGRQYRGLLNDRDATQHFRVVAFDLPFHGKSSPPAGYQQDTYLLTTDLYIETVMALKRALELDAPVVMGCSIGGRAVLHLMLRHGSEFMAAIGLQTALYADDPLRQQKNSTEFLHRSDVQAQEAVAGLVSGLMAPQSPDAERWETLWHYMQAGPGVFLGDIHYYKESGDLRNGLVGNVNTERCPLYLLTGEYDYSASPAMTQEVVREVPGAKFTIMTKLGHFPMSENYNHFREYLLPILEEIRRNSEKPVSAAPAPAR